ncbi:hypothetical protein AC579_8519 [Pseudocercospora musae]|uniref:Piwi domain-containing protein n=1 Tax=Pseudocercospora musae TaxID=113226 RepID=A0A139I9W6_9PEZI|nr:hypothetical protein AC579_8519 [Pseudocercospora musae]
MGTKKGRNTTQQGGGGDGGGNQGGSMQRKQGGGNQTTKPKKVALYSLCIRCDEADHPIEECVKQHPVDSTPSSQIWSGWSNAAVPAESLSSDRAAAQKTIDAARKIGKAVLAFCRTQDQVIEETRDQRVKAKKITKQALAHALEVVLQPDEEQTPGEDPVASNNDGELSAAQLFQNTSKFRDGVQPHAPADEITRVAESDKSHRNLQKTVEQPPADDKPEEAAIPPFAHAPLHGSVFQYQPAATSEHANFPLRSELATPNDQHMVLTNHFSIDIPQGVSLYEYHVNGIPAKATRAKKRTMILDMIEHDDLLWKKRDTIATDCQKKIISVGPLYSDVQIIHVNNYSPGTRGQAKKHPLELTFVACHDLDDLRDFVEGRKNYFEDLAAVDALNIALSKAVTDNNDRAFQVGNTRFYYRKGWKTLQDPKFPVGEGAGLISVRGYYSAVKPAMGRTLLNVNTVTSAFYKSQKVSEYFKEIFGSMKGSLAEKKRFAEAHLANLRVYVNFERKQEPGDDRSQSVNSESRRTKTLVSLGKPAKEQKFKVEGKEVEVWTYLKQKYPEHTSNDDLGWPTVNVGGKDDETSKYYLASQLTVVSDQIYRGAIPSALTRYMIDAARRTPAANFSAILGEGKSALQFHKSPAPPMLTSLGITISNNMLKVPARLIANPAVVYRHGRTISERRGWELDDTFKFLSTQSNFNRNGPGKATVQFFIAGRLKHPEFQAAYVENFLHFQGANGLQKLTAVQKPLDLGKTDFGSIKKTLLAHKADLVVLIFPRADAQYRAIYSNFRIVADQFLGIRSICLNEKKMIGSLRNFHPSNGLGDRFLVDYMRNVSMKLNLRNGATNHTVASNLLSAIGGHKETCDTMIIGADVTHPGAGSIPFAPSIAAVVASVDNNFQQMPGSMRLNPSRQEYIELMKDMTKERLRLWYNKNNKALPKRILFYRDGVGDSYRRIIRDTEVLAIKSAWVELRDEKFTAENLPADPQITAVIVTKRHHTRLFPSSIAPGGGTPADRTNSGNCQPGTVVETGVTSPCYFDFYLLSHNLLQGTAKPAHYFVIENGMGLSAKELQDLTYHLAYTYGRSTTPVSYAPPAYYADRLCERGRLYLKPLLDNAIDIKAKIKNDDLDAKSAAEEVMTRAKKLFYRNKSGGIGEIRNPWASDLDDEMFWM